MYADALKHSPLPDVSTAIYMLSYPGSFLWAAILFSISVFPSLAALLLGEPASAMFIRSSEWFTDRNDWSFIVML